MRALAAVAMSTLIHAALFCIPIENSWTPTIASNEIRLTVETSPHTSAFGGSGPWPSPMTPDASESSSNHALPGNPVPQKQEVESGRVAKKKPNPKNLKTAVSHSPVFEKKQPSAIPDSSAEAEPPATGESVDTAPQPGSMAGLDPAPQRGAAIQSDMAAMGSSGAGRGREVGPTLFGSSGSPAFASRVLPHYPRSARETRREGTVVLCLTIDEHGVLKNVEVVESAGFGFDEEALRAVRASTFKAALRNGCPVASQAMLPVRFMLKGSGND